MPTNRAGDRTATQSPSAKPEPEGTITQALPADGDPPNASTYLQAFKVVADFIDFLLKLQAKIGAWTQWIFSFRTAAGHKRLTVDHLGFPMGRIVKWDEDWSRGVSVSGNSSTNGLVGGVGPVDITGTPLKLSATFIQDLTTVGSNLSTAGGAVDFATAKPSIAAAGAALTDAVTYLVAAQGAGPWRVRTVQASTGSSVVIFNPPDNGTVQSRHRYAVLSSGDTNASDYALIYRLAPCNFDNDLHVALEWEAQLEATGMGGKLTACMGFCDENTIPASAGGAANDYVVFEKGPSGNWFIRYRSGGGTAQGIDTGVAATTTWTRFRIELHGSNVAESVGRALRCYINGTQVGGDITTNVPVTTAKAAPHFSCTTTTSGAHGLSFPVRLGPVRMAHNLYGSDVV